MNPTESGQKGVRALTETGRREPPTSCDYLVIGGGSGGCAAAGRLARNLECRVVVLESGGTNVRPDVFRPSAWPELLASDANWGYATTPQVGTNQRVHILSMGKVLGGSSSVNGMMYLRGQRWDYDAWAGQGNPGWDSEAVFAAFRAIEDFPEGDRAYHGTGGAVKLLQPTSDHPATEAFLRAAAERGFKRSADLNGPTAEGFATHQLNISGGRRQDAAAAFLEPLSSHENLTVVTGATAQQLVFASESLRVSEVVYRHEGEIRRIQVNNEVLLAAGAIASPQLLLRSGIGPPDELQSLGIKVMMDLPGVGKNLHDHVGVPVPFESPQPLPPSQYQLVEASLYCRTSPTAEHYNMQMTMMLFPYVPPGFEEYPCTNGFTLFPGILKPRSRGRVALRSANPDDPPIIDPAYLTEPDDLQQLTQALEIARDLGSSPAFNDWRVREVLPGPTLNTRAELENYTRQAASTYYHPVGTCKMGPDQASVVDHQLLVHGAQNLRVVDASIMPEVISSNTNAPSMMIGWKAAGFILGQADPPALADVVVSGSPR